jgi:hypothetical protein
LSKSINRKEAITGMMIIVMVVVMMMIGIGASGEKCEATFGPHSVKQ